MDLRKSTEMTLTILWHKVESYQELDTLFNQLVALHVLVAGLDEELQEDLSMLSSIVLEKRLHCFVESLGSDNKVVAIR